MSSRNAWNQRSQSGPRRQGTRSAALQQAVTEHHQAPALYAELMALPPRARRRAVAVEPRFASLALTAYLLAESRHENDTEAMEEHARLALVMAEALSPESYPEALVWDLVSHACGTLAGVRLRRQDLRAAKAALTVAQLALELGTGDPLARARHLEQVAALRRQQGRQYAAHVLLRHARKLYLEIGDEQAAAARAIASRLRRRCGLRLDGLKLHGSGRPAA